MAIRPALLPSLRPALLRATDARTSGARAVPELELEPGQLIELEPGQKIEMPPDKEEP